MEPLPFIDEHSQPIDAPADAVWMALLRVLRRQTAGGERFARVLGCEPAEATPDFSGRPGETVPGFRIAESEPGRRLALQGRHRFARYSLTFLVEDGLLRAQTHAAFPGFRGRLYRAAVIGTGGHLWVTRLLLRRVARTAEGTDPPEVVGSDRNAVLLDVPHGGADEDLERGCPPARKWS